MKKEIVFVLLIFIFSIFAQTCKDSGDCIEGYCYNGGCINPEVGDKIISLPCQNTSNCIEGYCVLDLNRCIIPTAGEKILNFGIKSGCAGIVTCSSDDLVCVIFCNLIWVILIILSILAGYFSKNLDNKLIPISAVVLPLFVALASVPFAGIVVAVIEIIIIMYYKQKLSKQETSEEYTDTTEYLPPIRKNQEEF
ncbi:hypothetical protein KO317_01065 [Candidatus Micrarchaeota archaeon]|nr:hypothetical protein [Candidatus Micrarchaeota archaeon]